MSACAPHVRIWRMTGLAWAKADKKICQLSSLLTLPSKHKTEDGPPATCRPRPQEAPHLSLPPTTPSSKPTWVPASQDFTPRGLGGNRQTPILPSVFPAPLLVPGLPPGLDLRALATGWAVAVIPPRHGGHLSKCLTDSLCPTPAPHRAPPTGEEVGRSHPTSGGCRG